jgi:hypothetical protein
MVNLLKRSAYGAGILLLAGTLMAGTPDIYGQPRATAPQARFAQPGTVNYIEGQVSLDGQSITQKAIGSAVVDPGHLLQTGNGKVEMLLTPGVFFRLGPNSTVKMISPSLSDTRVELVQGQAMMEVADFQKENHIQVTLGGSETTVKARGIYEFSTNPPMTRVYDGKVDVLMASRTRSLGKGGQLALDANNPKLKTQDFNLKQTEASTDLYNWSKLRADYTAQANMSAAQTYYGYGAGYAPGWYGGGWYWDRYSAQYAFLLGDGFLWDPFGFGFFSPGYWGLYGPYLGYGYYGHGFYGHPGGAITRGSVAGARIAGGGFAGRAAVGGGFHGGGFGGGGFHGGGFGGGGRR